MKQIEPAKTFSLYRNGRFFGKIRSLRTGERQNRFPLVCRRIHNVERNIDEGLFSAFHHPQIIFGALIGPSAFFVIGPLVTESHIHHRLQIESLCVIGFVGDCQLRSDAFDVFMLQIEPQISHSTPVFAGHRRSRDARNNQFTSVKRNPDGADILSL